MKTQNRKPVSKKSKTSAVPKGHGTVTPFLMVENAEEFIDFIKDAFSAEVVYVTKTDNDLVMHASVKLGTSMLMIADVMDGMKPESATLFLYLEDSDATYKKAIEAGAQSIHEPKDEFYGDRVGGVSDKWGNKWWIATHIEDVERDEMDKRAKENHDERKNDPNYEKQIKDWNEKHAQK